MFAAFLRFAVGHYRRADGTTTHEFGNCKTAMKPVNDLYGTLPAVEFTPRALKVVRESMIALGWCRTNVNGMVGRLKRIFRWGVAEELIPASAYESPRAVPGLRLGRSAARESDPVKPVASADVEATKPHVSRQVAALIDLQLLTGARPGELVGIRPIDIDTTGKVWTCSPTGHKTSHHGHARTIYIGPRGQEIIRPFLAGRAVDMPLFSPTDAEAERHEKMHAERKTPLNHGNRPGTNRVPDPGRVPGESYDVSSYRRCIQRACKAAGIRSWFPHQLRHSAGTTLRREFGLEAARAILGHKSVVVTQMYAEIDHEKAVAIVARVG